MQDELRLNSENPDSWR